MTEFIGKISSYHLFNYLFPGVIFVVLINHFTEYQIIQEDIVIGIFLYYFVGLVISRIGSLFIEPFFKKIGFIKFAEYKDFKDASKKDEKIDILSEVNNMYRTLIAVFLLFFVVKGYEILSNSFQWGKNWGIWILLISLFALFLFSYKKQTAYVKSAVLSTIRIDKKS